MVDWGSDIEVSASGHTIMITQLVIKSKSLIILTANAFVTNRIKNGLEYGVCGFKIDDRFHRRIF